MDLPILSYLKDGLLELSELSLDSNVEVQICFGGPHFFWTLGNLLRLRHLKMALYNKIIISRGA